MSRRADRAKEAHRRLVRRKITEFLPIIVLIILAIVVVLTIRKNRIHEPREPRPIPTVSPTRSVRRPVIPPMPPSTGSDDSLRLRFEHLVKNHPDLEVRKGIIEAGKNKNLKFSAETNPHVTAYLGIQRRTTLGLTYDNLGGRPFVAVMSVDIKNLEKIRTQDEMLDFMATLGHEYQHYKEWVVAPFEWWRDFETHEFGTIMTLDECSRMFKGELRGYHYQCEKLLEWGVRPTERMQNLCPHVGTPEFPEKLIKHLEGTTTAESNPECIPIWAEVARQARTRR